MASGRRRALVAATAVALAGAAVATVVLARGNGEPVVACDLFAATDGNDAAAGTRASPVRTPQRLAAALAGGGTGCLLGGTFHGDLVVEAGGSEAEPLTIRSAPGARATIHGIVVVRDTANWVTLEELVVDGRDTATNEGVLVKIFGDHVTLRRNAITTGGQRICVSTGDANGKFGIARYPVIEGNRIHDCGNRTAGPRSYPSGHALYLQADRFAVIRDNVIYDTNYGGTLGGRGIQLWPDSQDATIEHNVVDNANQWSIIVSGGDYPTGTTRGTKVRDNVLTYPVEHNVTSAWWDVDPQPGVEVTGNCLHGAPGLDLAFETWRGAPSYRAADNVHADPRYVDRARKDFRLRESSPCAGKGPRTDPPPPAPETHPSG